MRTRLIALVAGGALVVGGCATASGPGPSPSPGPTSQGRPTPSTRQVSAAQAERLQRLMVPLLQATDNARPPSKVKVALMDDPRVNAANAGGGEFYVTTGLLEKANDEQLLGVLAHEVAHDDLGHVAKAQTLGAGLNIGVVLLDRLIPGSGALTPIAGQLIARGYNRREEYEADRHGVALLERVGRAKDTMINTLTWLMQTEGGGGGGFFATHPATGDRIEALRELK
jgi:Zn-dependent protease with chaperone function